MIQSWLFLAAYACSGLAGLIYEVSWTRLLTLYMGHTTAAASAVVAAFMGGLAVGAAVGGRLASRLTRRQCLLAYIALEALVVVVALLLPSELSIVTPILSASYHDGAPGMLFPAMRLLSCLVMMFVPAAALGATFPVAVRWYVRGPGNGDSGEQVGRAGGALYAVNTAGAAVGALVAGFVLIPTIGVTWTTRVGVAASALAILGVYALVRMTKMRGSGDDERTPVVAARAVPDRDDKRRERRLKKKASALEKISRDVAHVPAPSWLAAVVLGLTGLASLMFEIAWTRVLALTIGPTIYAFSATLAVLIGGMAFGSAIGAWVAGRARRPALWLALVLAGAAMASSWAGALAGGEVPRRVAEQVAASPDSFDQLLTRGAMLIAALIFPTAAGLGAAFPLAFATGRSASRLGLVYAINTLGAVAGSLLAGFVFIPLIGLQQTLRLVSVVLILASLIVVFWGRLPEMARIAGTVAAIGGIAMLVLSPPWDRELLASGGYLYAAYAPKVIDLESALKAGTLLYYREGASATVSVKRLTGTVSLAIDGKVDASTRSDMLTQKVLAHLPLLMHEHPREICVIGLGSGVTLGAALRHPIEHADVVELSPEVVDASRYFAEQNLHALDDPRTRLIVGDGRSHLLLSKKQYDVIISEPSNPWIAGVASLFTREFFSAARDRLAPGGIICQWAHAYNISDRDLRSIVATFTSVFPNGTVWMIGEDDILLVASASPLDERLANVATGWHRPGVAEDLAGVGAREPFALWSLFVGGPAELSRYTQHATVFTDDRSALEFSAPRELHISGAGENAAALTALLGPQGGPTIIRRARTDATTAEWRNRGAMMFKSDMYGPAYEDYERALGAGESGGNDAAALDGLVQAAVMASRATDALERVKAIAAGRTPTPAIFIAQSKLLVSMGVTDAAVAAAQQASQAGNVDGMLQLASLYANDGKLAELDATVETLRRTAPERAATSYYAAVSAFLHGQFADTVTFADRAVAADPAYAAVYDLAGAAHTKLGDVKAARTAFETSLRLNAHDSSAYANLGLLELSAGNRAEAARDFSEALWLDPQSAPAREGLSQARQQVAR